jgi:hypothetical protein
LQKYQAPKAVRARQVARNAQLVAEVDKALSSGSALGPFVRG